MVIGAMCAPFERVALYRFEDLYASAPIDRLFGSGVDAGSLHGTAVSRALDVLFGADLEDLSWKCSEACIGRFGLESTMYHIDATNVSVYAITENVDIEGAPAAMYGGNSKTGRNDLRQYDAMSVADGNRVLRYLKAYSGNTSDTVMDAETIEFLKSRIDPGTSTIVADSKLLSEDIVSELIGIKAGFISKCPRNFSGKVRETIELSVKDSFMERSRLGAGYGVYDTDAETEFGTLRFIAYKTPSDLESSLEYFRDQGERILSKSFAQVRKRRFSCPTDARSAVQSIIEKMGDVAYDIEYDVVSCEERVRRSKRGRPPKGSAAPDARTYWRVDMSWSFDADLAVSLAKRDEIQVLVTNIPRANEDAENIRFGATADTVVRCYLDEYKPEHLFRLLKSGLGRDKVFLHRGSRVAAMMFIAGLAGTLLSVMDELLRRGNADISTYRMKLQLYDTTVRLKRQTGYMYIDGHPGAGMEIQNYCRIFNLDPDKLLG